jgi:hypothetical protein
MRWLFHEELDRVVGPDGKFVWAEPPDTDGYEVVERRQVGNSRWSIKHEGVFSAPDGRFWRCEWSEGATEMQDEEPWQYDEDVICTQVRPVKVTVVAYEAVTS